MEQPQQKAEQSGFGGFKGLIKIVRALDHHCVIWVREHELPGWIGHIPVSVAAMILLAGTMVDFEYVMVMLLTIIILLFYAFSTMVSGHHRTDDDQNSGLCCYRTEENMKQPQQKAEQSGFGGFKGLIKIVRALDHHCVIWVREHELPGWIGHIPVSVAAMILLAGIMVDFEYVMVMLLIIIILLFYAFSTMDSGHHRTDDDQNSGLCCYRTEENMEQAQQKAEQSQQQTEQPQQKTEQEYEQSDFRGVRGLIRIVKVVNYHFSVWAREHGLPGWTGHIPVSAAALILLTEFLANFENVLTFLGIVLGIVFFVLFTAFTECEWDSDDHPHIRFINEDGLMR